eukprot:GHVR01134075.1.p1 GENE.GHVR01134075.1~~GHVR01134075.1.p1  ORF type:complete len:225 (+),score=48.31 GHVR01134075.1:210-884(+)
MHQTVESVNQWEDDNNHTLPDDMKSFFQVSDGLTLTWTNNANKGTYIGCISVNPLVDIIKIPSTNLYSEDCISDNDDEDAASHDSDFILTNYLSDTLPKRRVFAGKDGLLFERCVECAYDLDSMCDSGRFALVYFKNITHTHMSTFTQKPQIWFMDLAGDWVFIANDFSDYFRLLVTHLGLPRWPLALTPIGLDKKAKEWLLLLAPHRLHIDTQGSNNTHTHSH